MTQLDKLPPLDPAHAQLKWPNVPACHDWLSLDRRGNWRLQGERVTHRGLIEFLNRHYAADERGCWFVQNGPQRVFVELAATPWIFRRQTDILTSHTGQPAGVINAVLVDESGNIYLDSELGIGLLDDRDLPALLEECRNNDGQPANDDDFERLLQGRGNIVWQGKRLQMVTAADLPQRYRYTTKPPDKNSQAES